MPQHAMPSTLRFLLAARRSELHGLEALASTCELATLVSKLVHVLQKERGSSNLYLCGGQDALRQTLAGLSSDACAVEEEVRRFLDRLEPDATRSAGKARLLNCIAYALYRLDELPRTRRAIRDRRVAAEEAGAVFTRLIASLFALVFEAADSSLDAGVTRLLVALLNFMQGKELCGQERAYGVMGYTAGYFTESQKARVLELADLQKRCFDSFAQYAGAEALAAWERLEQGAGPVLRLRDMALRTSEAERVDAGLAELWFGLCTERIDAMRAVESLLAEALTLQCHRRIVETRAELDNHRLLLSRFADHASDDAPAMLFQLQGRILDVPPQDGVGEAMERSILDLMRDQAQRLRQSDDALALARGALEERRRVERAKWLLDFMQGKELCGQERAYGVMGYTAGYFTESQKARVLELADLQKRCFDSFAQYAGAEALAAWERLEQGAGPVLRLRDMALRTSEAERVDAGLAELWFGLCTERIDAMRAVESLLAEALTLQCHRRIVETRAELDNHRLLLSRFADHASDDAPAMLFQLQGRILDVPPQDGVGEAMERSILDLMRDQAQRLRQSDDALALARGALEERRRVERAKWLLVSHHGLSEQAAHDQLQRVAMDCRRSLDEVARQVLAELDTAAR